MRAAIAALFALVGVLALPPRLWRAQLPKLLGLSALIFLLMALNSGRPGLSEEQCLWLFGAPFCGYFPVSESRAKQWWFCMQSIFGACKPKCTRCEKCLVHRSVCSEERWYRSKGAKKGTQHKELKFAVCPEQRLVPRGHFRKSHNPKRHFCWSTLKAISTVLALCPILSLPWSLRRRAGSATAPRAAARSRGPAAHAAAGCPISLHNPAPAVPDSHAPVDSPGGGGRIAHVHIAAGNLVSHCVPAADTELGCSSPSCAAQWLGQVAVALLFVASLRLYSCIHTHAFRARQARAT